MSAWISGLSAEHSQPLDESESAAETSRGGNEAVEWVTVASTVGTPNAVIIAGRLENHGIPTRVTQEAAGLHAIPVNVGMLSSAKVWVPAEHEAQALEILSQDWDEEE
jgi:hypothetical protein